MMKSRNPLNPSITAAATWLISSVVIPARALHYILAALIDERNGFPYTAAMEWRQAADLFSPTTRAADYFWQQWERIMHLPRRLARPMEISCQTASSLPVASASQPCNRPTANQLSIANAA